MKARVRTAALLIATLLSTFLVVTGGSAATPPSGTISLEELTLHFEGNAIVPAYPPSNLALAVDGDGCPPQSADPEDVVCGHFTVTVEVPEGHWDDNYGFLEIILGFPSGDDWELAVYKDGNVGEYDYGSVTGSSPERVVIPNPEGVYEIRAVPYTVTSGEGFTGDLELVTIPLDQIADMQSPGFQAFHGTPPDRHPRG